MRSHFLAVLLLLPVIAAAQGRSSIQMASWTPGSAPILYPPLLAAAEVEGPVDVSFVVDIAGRVDLSSLKIMKSPHDLFSQSVRDAVAAGRATPAIINGLPRSQLLRHRFVFASDSEPVCHGKQATTAPHVTLVCAPHQSSPPHNGPPPNCGPPSPFKPAQGQPCPTRPD